MSRISWKTLMQHEGDALLTFLQKIEDAFVRAIYGIWLFIVTKIPDLFRNLFAWLNEKFFYACRVAMRLGRVAALMTAWLAIVFGPVVAYASIVTGAWVVLALAGSAYGLHQQIKAHNGAWSANKEVFRARA